MLIHVPFKIGRKTLIAEVWYEPAEPDVGFREQWSIEDIQDVSVRAGEKIIKKYGKIIDDKIKAIIKISNANSKIREALWARK